MEIDFVLGLYLIRLDTIDYVTLLLPFFIFRVSYYNSLQIFSLFFVDYYFCIFLGDGISLKQTKCYSV